MYNYFNIFEGADTMGDWNSRQYTKFERERTQPSADLIRRLDISPKTVLDIGCGPGNSTNRLYERFPSAEIIGIDSSENMLETARESYPNLKFEKCFVPDGLENLDKFDLIFSNACLHWIPNHSELLPKLVARLNDGGVLAVQMPLVQCAAFYKMLNSLVSYGRWEKLRVIQNFHNMMPNETYDILAECSKSVTMWETTYYHIVPSHMSVIEWYKGSGLRPYLEMLGDDEREDFISDLLKMIEENYPVQADGNVILKMPRMFFIAEK